MKILQLCNKLPFPEKDGGAIAISALTRSLLNTGCNIKMLAMNTKKHYTNLNAVPMQFKVQTRLEAVSVNTKVNAPKALLNLLTGKSYNVTRFYSHEFKNKLVSILNSEPFDVILLEGLYLTPYIPYLRKLSRAPVFFRAHNVEWMIWKRLSNEERFTLKKAYLNKLAKQLRDYESKVVSLCDAVLVFTANDKIQFEEMECKCPIEIIPFGINLSGYQPKTSGKPFSFFFIGALDWMPNIQGLEWFLEHVWQKIRVSHPQAEFHIAGRKMPKLFKEGRYDGVVCHGEVDNAVSFMQDYQIMVVPLFAGSGMRVKIIEGMALQKPVIATTIGAEGIAYGPGADLIIANTSQEFLQAARKCFEYDEFTRQMGVNARKIVENHYDIDKITRQMILYFARVIENKKLQVPDIAPA